MNLESLQSRRAWLAGGAVLAVLIVAASYFLVILPKLAAASDTRAQARDNDVTNSRLVTRRAALARQERGIATMRADLSAALTALPSTSALPEFTHEATHAATATGVTLQNISIGSLTPVAPTAAAPAATDSATSATATTTPAAGSTASSATQYQISVTLTTSGPTDKQLAFVKAVQNGSRRALITSTSFSGTGSKIGLTTQLNIFTATMSDQQVAQLRKLLVAG